MKILLEQDDNSIGEREYNLHDRLFLFRRAARAVLLDEEGMVYLMHLKKRGIYKLPGGGIDKGESVKQGLEREVREEAGVAFNIVKELGVTIESRYYEGDDHGLLQVTYAYLVKLKGNKGEPDYTEEEFEEGAEGVWVDKQTALDIVRSYPLPDYEAHFIQNREIKILEEAQKYWDQV